MDREKSAICGLKMGFHLVEILNIQSRVISLLPPDPSN